MTKQELYRQKLSTVEQCLAEVQEGDTVVTGCVLNEPMLLMSRFHEAVPGWKDVTVIKSLGCGLNYDFMTMPDLEEHVHFESHFYDAPMRKAGKMGNGTYVVNDLHNYGRIHMEHRPCTVLMLQVAPMNEEGCFQVAYGQMFENEALACNPKIILEVNPNFSRINGGIEIPIERVTRLVETDRVRPTSDPQPLGELDRVIGGMVADLIHDGDCLQLGIGNMPDAVAEALMQKNDLGLHTEMFTSSMAGLIESGVVTGKRKNIDTGLHVGAFAMGSERLYRVLSENPNVRIRPCAVVNSPFEIAKIDNMVSVNTVLEIDLTGQVCSESIGTTQFSGTGGSFDFAFGAFHSKGGRGILAFHSTTKGGTVSKIKPILTPGSFVSISRNTVDYVVTEYGVVRLRGRSVAERAEALISIAHPDFRDELRAEAKKYGFLK